MWGLDMCTVAVTRYVQQYVTTKNSNAVLPDLKHVKGFGVESLTKLLQVCCEEC